MPLILILLSVILQVEQPQPAVIRAYQYFIALANKSDPRDPPPRRELAPPILAVNPRRVIQSAQIIASVE
jgi:hypothetical protein